MKVRFRPLRLERSGPPHFRFRLDKVTGKPDAVRKVGRTVTWKSIGWYRVGVLVEGGVFWSILFLLLNLTLGPAFFDDDTWTNLMVGSVLYFIFWIVVTWVVAIKGIYPLKDDPYVKQKIEEVDFYEQH